jgi:beta-lactam-binding protein with PASTA domain
VEAVPNVVGSPVADARTTLESAGFAVAETCEVYDPVTHPVASLDTVVAQTPSAGASANPDATTVTLTVRRASCP